MKKEMFISAQQDECRIAIVTDGALTELYTERTANLSQVGNIFKARITNIEPSIQAAFVDFGKPKNGFLHISDVHPKYFPGGEKNRKAEAVGHKRARRDRPPIQACLKRNQEITVQVTKEGIGTKGATLTTYLSIAGRYLVLMPGMHRLGISRRIEEENDRARMRTVLAELKPPPELGFIVRTAGIGQPKSSLQRDLHYLLRLWKAVSQRSGEAPAPAELHQESDLVIRTIRDVYNTDINRVVCDQEAIACKVGEFLQLIMPRTTHHVDLYEGEVDLFQACGLEREFENINARRVPLPAGGSLVIDQTEALVAIDVNSGRFRASDDAESMAVQINTEAAREAARQLRIRDLGGVIVIDFIDMAQEKNRRKIERIVRDEMKKDRAKSKQLRMSQFGIVEITRQRMRPSLASSIFRPCVRCGGSGRVKSPESQTLAAMRTLRLAASESQVATVQLSLSPPVAEHVLNQRRGDIARLERDYSTKISIHADANMPADEIRVQCTDARGAAIQWDPTSALARRPKQASTREITKADVAAFGKRSRAAAAQTPQPQPKADVPPAPPAEAPATEQPAKKKSRRRRRRKKSAQPVADQPPAPPAQAAAETPKKKPRRRRRKKTSGQPTEQPPPPEKTEPAAPAQAKKKPRRRRRRRKSNPGPSPKGESPSAGQDKPNPD